MSSPSWQASSDGWTATGDPTRGPRRGAIACPAARSDGLDFSTPSTNRKDLHGDGAPAPSLLRIRAEESLFAGLTARRLDPDSASREGRRAEDPDIELAERDRGRRGHRPSTGLSSRRKEADEVVGQHFSQLA